MAPGRAFNIHCLTENITTNGGVMRYLLQRSRLTDYARVNATRRYAVSDNEQLLRRRRALIHCSAPLFLFEFH